MKTAKNLGFVLAGMALLALTLISPGSAAPTPPAPTNVNIVSPLTSGAVTVGGTVNVGTMPSVSISGTPTVGLAGGSSVLVGNNAANPVLVRDVDSPGMQPFEALGDAGMSPGADNTNVELFTVDSGKRLVIEYVSAHFSIPTGQKFIDVRLQDTVGAPYHLVPVLLGTRDSRDIFSISQPLRMYVGPGHTVLVSVERDANTGGVFGEVEVFGYLVNVP